MVRMNGGGDQMAHDVADHQARKGCQRPDRQRAETVEQSLAEIGRQTHAVNRPGVEHHRLHQECPAGRTADIRMASRPARRPNTKVNSSVNMIGVITRSNSCSGTCLNLRKARQPKTSALDSGRWWARARHLLQLRQRSGVAHGCVSFFAASRGGLPVSAKNTSSRLGCPIE